MSSARATSPTRPISSSGTRKTGFKEADYIKEETFSSQRVAVGFIEPHACLAEVDATGRVLLQGSKQSPYPTWRHMCRALDLPLSKMRLVTPFVGGAFSGKHDPFDVDFAAVKLAQITNRPVKIVLNYDEVLAAYRQRNAMNANLKMGLKKNGRDHGPQGRMRARKAGPLQASDPSTSTSSVRGSTSLTKYRPSSITASSSTRTGRPAAR